MRTWYDTGTKQWLTQDANGQTRAATHAEALLYISNGGQAPAGVPLPALPGTFNGQMGPPPIPNTPATGPGTAPPIPPAPAAPATPAIPTGWGNTPVTTNYGWGTGFQGSTAGAQSPFANLTGTQQAYYQQNPDQANSLLRQWLAPNPNSAFAQFINARQGDLTTQFAAASTKPGNESLQYTDWLKQNFGQLSDQFAGQSATQRGQDPAQFGGGFAGRAAFS